MLNSLLHLDAYITSFFASLKTLPRELFDFPSIIGTLSFYVIVFLILWFIEYRKYKNLTNQHLKSLIGFSTLFGVTFLLKAFVGRVRPELSVDGTLFYPYLFTFNTIFHSFPSSHSATLWYLFFYFNRKPSVLWLAVYVCISRIALEKHFFLDVVAGGGLAYGVYYSLEKLYPWIASWLNKKGRFKNLPF
jgi:membrane-associated phospholipid phosphatase